MTTEWFDPIVIEEKRSLGWSWRKIAKGLGKTKSTVHDRYTNWDARRTRANNDKLKQLDTPIRIPKKEKKRL